MAELLPIHNSSTRPVVLGSHSERCDCLPLGSAMFPAASGVVGRPCQVPPSNTFRDLLPPSPAPSPGSGFQTIISGVYSGFPVAVWFCRFLSRVGIQLAFLPPRTLQKKSQTLRGFTHCFLSFSHHQQLSTLTTSLNTASSSVSLGYQRGIFPLPHLEVYS